MDVEDNFFKNLRRINRSKKNNTKLDSEENNTKENNTKLGSKKNNIQLSSKENNTQLRSEESDSFEESDNQLSSEENNIRVVVGLDFGTTYSGFAYCHVSENKNLCSNDNWHGEVGQLKTNTVLQYDDEYNNVKLWGAPALAKKQSRRAKNQSISKDNKPVEMFKLHLGDLLRSEEHTSELQSLRHLVCRLLLEK